MFDWNWRGVIVAFVLLGLLLGDLAVLGHTTIGYIGCAVIVVVSAIVLRTGLGPRWLHQ